MSNIKERNLPCPHQDCHSSDAFVKYEDGSDFCYSCYRPYSSRPSSEEDFVLMVQATRGITESTMRLYDVETKIHKDTGEGREVGFKYPNGAVKSRLLSEKRFFSSGDMQGAHLFGSDKFEGGGKAVIITEGEFDALSCYQVARIPSVSVRSSSSAFTDCTSEHRWLNSFDRIIIAFDNDEKGNEAAGKISSLFAFDKIYRAAFNQYKDANEYLQNDKSKDLLVALKSAAKYTPDNISSSFDDILRDLAQERSNALGSYPFQGLQDRLYGMHEGEVVVFKGLEGIGKTEVFRAMENHLLKENPNNKIGVLHLEEDKGTTIKGICNYANKHPYLHPNDKTAPPVMLEVYKGVMGDENRMYIYESFDVEDNDALYSNLRFLVSVCGCKFIFLDHISWLATGNGSDDERRKLDSISQKLKLLAKELNFCLVMISHVNDEGLTRGSRNITKAANTVIHMSRDKTSPVDSIRLRTNFTIEKSRLPGAQSGEAGYAQYDIDTLTLEDEE